MKRYCIGKPEPIEDVYVDAFLYEIELVCKKHKLSISHEDSQGSFVIEEYDSHNIKRLMNSAVDFG